VPPGCAMTPADSRALMAREIAAQPSVLAGAGGPLVAAAAPLAPASGVTLWICGCGDGLYAGETMARIGCQAGLAVRAVSAAAMLWDAAPQPGDVCAAVSISGGTARTVEAAARARAAGARVVAVTASATSALARVADGTLRLPYEPISRQTPHSLDHTIALLALAALFGLGTGALHAAVEALAAADEPMRAEAERVVAGLSRDARFFCLGSGSALGAAGYAAAKLHEAGGLPAFALESENVAHGANFMMRPGDHATLCGDGGPGDRRTAALTDGLRRLGLSVATAGLDRPLLAAAMETALWAQRLTLAVAGAFDLDVTRPGGDGLAAAVQSEWFAWRSG
jgi:fructoselysine-6-P-deglycase FrlB-like protein